MNTRGISEEEAYKIIRDQMRGDILR